MCETGEGPSALLSLSRYFDVTQWSFCFKSNIETRAGGGLSPFSTTGAQSGASADVKEKRFSFKQVDINYTFELIDKIDLSASPTLVPNKFICDVCIYLINIQ